MMKIYTALFLVACLLWEITPSVMMRADAQTIIIRRRTSGGGGGSPVAYDAVGNGKCCGNGQCTACASNTTLTFAHTTGGGTERALDVFCAVTGASGTLQPAISTMTYNGVSMSEVAATTGNYKLRHWALPSGTQPATGSNNVVVTLASSLVTTAGELSCGSISFTGVDQTSQFTSSGTANSGSDTTAEWSIPTNNSGDMGVVAVCSGTSVGTTTNGTVRYDAPDDGFTACGTLGIATTASGVTSGVFTVGNDSWLTLTAAKNGSN